MNRLTRSLLTAFLLPLGALAQQNLIPNGSFEKTVNHGDFSLPVNWGGIFPSNSWKAPEAHTGTNALELDAGNSSFLSIKDEMGRSYLPIPIKVGVDYTLSFWYKGKMLNDSQPVSIDLNITTWINIFNGESKITQKTVPPSVKAEGTWKQMVINFKVDEPNATHVTLWFSVNRWLQMGRVFVDDFDLREGSTPPYVEKPKAPGTPKQLGDQHQREALIGWAEFDPSVTSWELTLEGKDPVTVTTKEYLITGLEPGKRYNYTLKSIKGKEKSEPVEGFVLTSRMDYEADSPDRIPYLRTLKEVSTHGKVSKTLDLFFNDLARGDAKITYYVDGTKVEPKGHTLTFPKTGSVVLRMVVEESSTDKWDILYKLTVTE